HRSRSRADAAERPKHRSLRAAALSGHGLPIRILRNVDSLMAEGRLARALVMAMKEAQMGPAFFRAMPAWLTERLTGLMLAQEDRKGSGAYVSMHELAPTLHYDFQLVAEASGRIEHFKAIHAEVH